MARTMAERIYVKKSLTDSKSDDEEVPGMATLESELRFLYNRVAQIECNTEQRLTDLGRRIQNLTKKLDSMQMTPYCSEPPANCRRTEESQSLMAGEDRYPSQSTRMASGCHHEPFRHRERPTSSSNVGSSYMKSSSSSSSSTGYSGSFEHRDPNTREVCRIPTYSKYEAEQLRMSVSEREKNIQNQDRELKERRSQLEARIKSLTDDVMKAAEHGLPPPFDKPSSPRQSPRLHSPPPTSSPPTIHPKLQLASSNASHAPNSSTKYSSYADCGCSSYSHSQPVY